MKRQTKIRYVATEQEAHKEPLTEHIEHLQRLLASVPPEHQATAKITIGVEQWGDDCEALYKVYYKSPETDTELEKRLEFEQKRDKQQELRELTELARLKAKYEKGETKR